MQDQKRQSDAVATGVAIVLFWPAAFFVGGNGQTAAELANLKGQMQAIEQASIAKKCNIQFAGPRPEGTGAAPAGTPQADAYQCPDGSIVQTADGCNAPSAPPPPPARKKGRAKAAALAPAT